MFIVILRNIQHRPFHTVLTIFTVAIAVAALLTSLWLSRGLESGLRLGIERLGADIVVVSEEIEIKAEQMLFTGMPLNVYMSEQTYADIRALRGVKQATPQFFTRTADAACCSLSTAGRVIGIDSETDFTVTPWLEESLGRPLDKQEIIVGSKINVKPGDKLLIRARMFRVVGQLAPTGTGMDDSSFIPLETARSLAAESPDLKALWVGRDPGKLLSAVLIRVEDPKRSFIVAKAVNELPGVRAIISADVMRDTQLQMGKITTLLYALTAVLWLVALVALLGRFASLVNERKTEIGIMRALGAMRGRVARLILWEGGFLALAGGLLGIGIGWFASQRAGEWATEGTLFPFLSLSFAESAGLYALCLAAAVATVTLSALIPAYRSASLDPARAIAQGELE